MNDLESEIRIDVIRVAVDLLTPALPDGIFNVEFSRIEMIPDTRNKNAQESLF